MHQKGIYLYYRFGVIIIPRYYSVKVVHSRPLQVEYIIHRAEFYVKYASSEQFSEELGGAIKEKQAADLIIMGPIKGETEGATRELFT